MKKLRDFLDSKVEPLFHKGGKYQRFYPLYEMVDTIAFTPATVTKGLCHVRDGLDQKRMMIAVVIALVFPLAVGLYNIGLQANLATAEAGLLLSGWRIDVLAGMGIEFAKNTVLANFLYGLLYFIPIFLVTVAAGGLCEVIIAFMRRHEVTEGFLVTSFLIPMIMPPTVPLWQVALATVFGVVIGKEIFGGVGFNFLNPALTARAFIFFAYPAEMSGDAIWVAADGITKATPLGIAALNGVHGAGGLIEQGYTLQNAFVGFIPGSIGEVSTLACLLGAFMLIALGLGSWRVMFSVFIGMLLMASAFNGLQSFSDNLMYEMSPLWHFVLGGYAFGLVYMATDPVSSAMTEVGKYIYGILIGILVVLIRVVNPAYPEGMMLAILFMNVLAPVIDHYVMESNIKKRMRGYGRKRIS